MILITTAGKVGSEAARLLAQRGAPVRVLVRNAANADAMAQIGADVAQGDLDDAATIDAAMQDVTSVILVSPAVPGQELNVIESATRAGVAHVVKITSKASADSPIARQRGHSEIEAGLIASGLGYTLLRNNFYMQNFLALAPVIAKTDSFGSSAGDGKVGLIDARDVAAAAVEIAASPGGHADKTYWLIGPEPLSYSDVAAKLSTVLDRTITFRPQSRDDDAQAMIAAGLPAPIAEMNALAVSLIAEGDAAWTTEDVPTLLGRPGRSFEQFATDYAAAFS